MIKPKKFTILFCLCGVFLFSQDKKTVSNSDSLIKKSYTFLKKEYFQNRADSILSKIYANAYILKSKQELNYDKLTKGYELMSYLHKDNIGIQYADSIIQIAQNFPDKNYFAKGHLVKGNQFFLQRDFKKSLDDYLKAHEYAIKTNDQELIHSINHVVGLLKNRAGNYDEALILFKNNYRYYSSLYHKDNFDLDPYFLAAVFALSNAYIKVGKLDSASYYNRIGFKTSLQRENKEYINIFTFNEGINQYSKKNYTATIDSLSKVIPNFIKFNDKPNTAYASSFLGKAYTKVGNINKAIVSLKKVDEIFKEINDIHPEIRDSYEILIDHYKKENKKEKQLEYIEKLLKVDSMLLENYKYLWGKIDKGYDQSNLQKEKEIIIESLENKNKLSILIIFVLSVLSLIAISFWVVNFKKKKIYKRRFNNLIKEKEPKPQDEELTKIKSDSIGFSQEIVINILKHLDEFEKNNEFVKQDITTSLLAEKFNTNSRYLSKVINTYKKKNFNNYLNDLRINFVIEKLKNNKKYRNYTIKAIANEVGFKKAESFSKAFFKITGIYPSFFIKQLNKQMGTGTPNS